MLAYQFELFPEPSAPKRIGRPPTYLATDKIRRCAKCKTPKAIDQFSSDATMASGISHVCKPCKNADRSVYYYTHHEKEKARHRKHHKKNRLYYREQNARYLLANPAKVKQYVATRNVKASYKSNRSKWLHTTMGKAYRRLKCLTRRARHRNAPGKATRIQIEARVAFYGWQCWICQVPYEAIDHVKPLSKGGSQWPSNLRPICLSCNSRKHNNWPWPKTA